MYVCGSPLPPADSSEANPGTGTRGGPVRSGDGRRARARHVDPLRRSRRRDFRLRLGSGRSQPVVDEVRKGITPACSPGRIWKRSRRPRTRVRDPLAPRADPMYDFSIIAPTYGRPASLAQLLHSLTRLNYSSERFEVIVVDDGGPVLLNETVSALRKPAPRPAVMPREPGPRGSTQLRGARGCRALSGLHG